MADATAANRFLAVMRDFILGLVRGDGADLSARQLSVLLICFLEDGPHTVRGLAERLNVATPAILDAVARLEEFELLRRAPDPSDQRSVLIARTAPGSAYIAYIQRLMNAAAKAHGVELRASAGRAAA